MLRLESYGFSYYTSRMTITIIGTGFVGVVSASVFASFGHQVFGLDVDEHKIASLSKGVVPFFEPHLEELVKSGLSSGKLLFTTDYAQAVPQSDVVIIAVGTPSAADGTADLTYVMAAATALAPHLKESAIVAIKSTVPPGSSQKVKTVIDEHTSVSYVLVSLPEFLREGSAVEDTLHADRVVIGASEPWAIDRLLELHKPIDGERVIVKPESAQMAKYSANAYLALRITFINQIADLCEKTGANVQDVIRAIGPDKRIGSHYWYPGLGYGGSCFPKDVKELAAVSKKLGEQNSLLIQMDQINDSRIERKMAEYSSLLGGYEGKQIAVLGLAFKPNTTDMRVAPSLKVIPYLKDHGATIKAYDPKAMDEARKLWPTIFYGTTAIEAVQEADMVLVLVEWDEFKTMDLQQLASLVKPNTLVVDTRNILIREKVEAVGLRYIGIGNT